MKKLILMFMGLALFCLIACTVTLDIDSSYTINLGDEKTLEPVLSNKKEAVFKLEIIEGEELISLNELTIVAIGSGNAKVKVSTSDDRISKEISIIITNNLTVKGANIVALNDSIVLVVNKQGVNWTSSDESVASVVDGVVVGKNIGVCVISVTLGEEVYNHSISVTGVALEIDEEDITIVIGKEKQLIVNKEGVVWNSSNSNVASVSQTGLVTPHQVGEVVISATLNYEVKSITFNVIKDSTVVDDELSLSGPTMVYVGETIVLNVNKTDVIWASLDETIATVNNGLVTGVGYGEVVIIVSTNDEEKSMTIFVDIEGLLIEGPSIMIVNTSILLTSYELVNWYSSDETIATVVEGLVNAKKVGEVTITVMLGEHKMDHEVSIIPNQFIIEEHAATLVANERMNLVVTDLLATSNQPLIWSSSNTAVASVSSAGQVRGVSPGNVTISAKSRVNDASVDIELEILVQVPTSIVIINAPVSSINTSTDMNLILQFTPSSSDKSVVWKSSDDRIAYVEDGRLIIDTPGKVIITVCSSHNSSISSSFEVDISYDINKLLDDMMMKQLITKTLYANYNEPVDSTPYSRQPNNSMSSVSYYYFGAHPSITLDFYTGARGGNVTRGTLQFVTVHDSGTTNAGSDAKFMQDWGSDRLGAADVSWHYTVDDKSIWQMLPESKGAWHAGDGTAYNWDTQRYYTGISANGSLRQPVTGINWVTRRFTINGQDTSVAVPSSAPTGSKIPVQGFFVEVGVDGYYYMRPTWYASGYGTVANNGGNLNSIGIESCVNLNSDFYKMFHHLAYLVADILLRNDLGFDRVKQHNFYSGKNCPQTLRGNELWDMFMTMVKIEYYVKTELINKGYTLQLESSNTSLISNNGRVIARDTVATNVNVKVSLIDKNNVTTNQKIYTYTVPAR